MGYTEKKRQYHHIYSYLRNWGETLQLENFFFPSLQVLDFMSYSRSYKYKLREFC